LVSGAIQLARPTPTATAQIDHKAVCDAMISQNSQQTRCRAESEIAIACVVNVGKILLIAAHAGI
jgi:hypothetical protein